MHNEEPFSSLEALPDTALRARLARTDWEKDPEFVSNEQVFGLFLRARQSGAKDRIGLFSRVLSYRLLRLARQFVVRSGIYPGLIGNVDQAAEELTQFLWECLISRPGDAAHAQKFFGQTFKRRAIDFQKRLLAKKRKCQDSLDDALHHAADDDDPERTIQEVTALRTAATPEEAYAAKQKYAQAASRLQAILSQNEHSTYVMLFVEGMQVKEIAAALGVSTKSINNYKNAAIEKIGKEFKNDIA